MARTVFCLLLLLVSTCLLARENPFVNVADGCGLAAFPALRTQWLDADEDGFADIIINGFSPTEYVFLLSRPDAGAPGKRRFVDHTLASGIQQRRAGEGGRRSHFFIVGDVNNDGHLDLFSGVYCDFKRPRTDKEGHIARNADGEIIMAEEDHGDRSEILLGDGKGHFALAPAPGVDRFPAATCAAVFLDYDRDGCLDLFVGNSYREYGLSLRCYQSRLFKGHGTGAFTDVTGEMGMALADEPGRPDSRRPVYGVAHSDWDNDGWQDILVCAYGRQRNMLWRNRQGRGFTDMGQVTGFAGDAVQSGFYPPMIQREREMPFRANGNTFDCACRDYDNDGDVDCFLAEITHWWAGPSSDPSSLLINLGHEQDFRFQRMPKLLHRLHLSVYWNQGDLHAGWLDYNNDGLSDLVISSSDYPDAQYLKLFAQQSACDFVNLTDSSGFAWQNASQISFADYDLDGDEDILVGNSHMRLTQEQKQALTLQTALFQNRCTGRNWLALRVRGLGKGHTNRAGIGVRIYVTAGGVTQMREVYGGCGHCGHQNGLDVHFGLGNARVIQEITVRWQDKKLSEQRFTQVPVNSRWLAQEGSPELQPFPGS